MNHFNTFVAPSGNERRQLEWVREYLSQFISSDDIWFDKMNNLIAVAGKGKGEKVMFSSHSDTIGFIVHFIDENGFLRLTPLGGINPKTLIGRKIRFTNGVDGVLYFEESDTVMNRAFADIGVSTKADAEALVPVGTAGSVVGDAFLFGKTGEEKISSPFLDDRIACAVQMIAIEELFSKKTELKNEIYFVFSVQEEVGIRGATTAAFGIDPVYGVAIDVTSTGDIPNYKSNVFMKQNAGACIKIIDSSVICSPSMVKFMRESAEKHSVHYQMEVLPSGGTDTAAIQRARSGVYAGCISIPTRYIHSPAESASVADIEACVELMVDMISDGFDF